HSAAKRAIACVLHAIRISDCPRRPHSAPPSDLKRAMQLFGKDLDKDLVVVAEAGVNHESNVDAALKLVRLAAEGGADAIKFQAYTPERLVSSTRADALTRVARFQLDQEGHLRAAEEGKRLGIPVFSSAITEDFVPFLGKHFSAIKIASGDIDFEPVIRA